MLILNGELYFLQIKTVQNSSDVSFEGLVEVEVPREEISNQFPRISDLICFLAAHHELEKAYHFFTRVKIAFIKFNDDVLKAKTISVIELEEHAEDVAHHESHLFLFCWLIVEFHAERPIDFPYCRAVPERFELKAVYHSIECVDKRFY